MAYIRERDTEITGFQVAAHYTPRIDLQCDFVMVYGTGNSVNKRIKEYREQGYVVHLMTGVAWGLYKAYLDGGYDGRSHRDEAQRRRDGSFVEHGDPDIPYMVPTIAYSDYLTEIIKPVIDAGVEAIHLEEPEYWGFGGHAEALKREYEFYYKEPWIPVESNVDSIYRSSKLMAYLYTRAVDRICSSLKEYAMAEHGRNIRFYVATHSLISYTQIHMVSPESMLIDIPSLDGYIAQIWTGTSRAANEYQGVIKERTFETGFLEYGIMQELVKGTDKRMWFLHDPVEDDPKYDWDDYEENYIKTVVASLFHPKVWHYEICPWPDRVFIGTYPKNHPDEEEKPIPEKYATKLSVMFQMLGDMQQSECFFEGNSEVVGLLIGDSSMYQRSLPDDYADDMDVVHAVSALMPDFFGLAMPLIKYGLPVRPVQSDNIRRIPGYLDEYKVIVLSYEFFKPDSPDINVSIVNWIMNGGVLVYIGDGSDPFHKIRSWWNKDDKYKEPAQHLFDVAGFGAYPNEGVHNCGKGHLVLVRKRPALLAHSTEGANIVRSSVSLALDKSGSKWTFRNHFLMRRGPYIIVSCMTESVSEDPVELNGTFVDMTDPELDIVDRIIVRQNENKVIYDLDKINSNETAIIGTSLRISEFDCDENKARLVCRGVISVNCVIRVKIGFKPREIICSGECSDFILDHDYDEASKTVRLRFMNPGGEIVITFSR